MTARKPVADSPPFLLRIWGFLISLKVGIVLLALLAVGSIIGTLVPPDEATNQSQLQRAQELVFSSWWYLTLLVLLALNMTCATVRNVFGRILPAMHPRPVDRPEFYQVLKPGASIELPNDLDADTVAETFRRNGFRVFAKGAAGYARRGMLSIWGAPVSHLGFVMLLLGGFISVLVAREGYMTIVEGYSSSQAQFDGVKQPLDFTVECVDFDTDFFPGTRIPSKYISTVLIHEPGRPPRREQVEVNRSAQVQGWTLHQTSYQELPRSERYRLTLSRDGGASRTLELSQGQTRSIPDAPGLSITLAQSPPLRWQILENEDLVQAGTLESGQSELAIRAVQFEPDFIIGADRQVMSRSRELNNPALKVTIESGDQPIASQWLFGREEMKAMMHATQDSVGLELISIEGSEGNYHFQVEATDPTTGEIIKDLHLHLGETVSLGIDAPGQDPASEPTEANAGPWQVRLMERIPHYATTLSMTRNPVLPFIYLGCAIMLVGLVMAFFIRRKEVWYRLDRQTRRLDVVARYRHPREDFDPQVAGILNQLQSSKGEA